MGSIWEAGDVPGELAAMRIAGKPLMRPLRSPPNDFEIVALCRCQSCGKTRELASHELYGVASMEAFRELEPRLRCTDCGNRDVSVEPIFHSDWRG
jgi:hypothetical protein